MFEETNIKNYWCAKCDTCLHFESINITFRIPINPYIGLFKHKYLYNIVVYSTLCILVSTGGVNVWKPAFHWQLELSEDLTIAPFWHYLRRKRSNWKLVRKMQWDEQIVAAWFWYTQYIHPLGTVHVCTKFQPSRPHNSQENSNKIFNAW